MGLAKLLPLLILMVLMSCSPVKIIVDNTSDNTMEVIIMPMENRTLDRKPGDGKGVVPHPEHGFVAVPPGTIIEPKREQICTNFTMDAHQSPDAKNHIEVSFTYFDQDGMKMQVVDVKGQMTVDVSQHEILWIVDSIKPQRMIRVVKKEFKPLPDSAKLTATLVLDNKTLTQQIILPYSLLEAK